MKKLSTGDDSTLGNWLKLAKAAFGEDSEPVRMLENKIKESPNGEEEEVIAEEGQFLMLLSLLEFGD